MVSRRSTARSPGALRVPNMIFRQWTAVLRARSAALFVPFVHRGEEMLVLHEEGMSQVAHVRVRRVEMPLPQGKEPLLDRHDLRDELRAREGRPAGGVGAPEAMPQPKQPTIEREGLAAEA